MAAIPWGGRLKKTEVKSHFERHWLRYGLAVVFFFALFGVGYFAENAQPYMEHLCMAISISAFIAFVFEIALHQRFAKNVFEASIGYLLPEEMQGELKWLYDQPFICEDLTIVVHLFPIEGSGGLLKEQVEMTRVIRNITSSTHNVQPGLWIEDNLHKGYPSAHQVITLHVEGETRSPNYASEIEIKRTGLRITNDEKRVPKFKVRPGGKATFVAIFSKTVREQDSEYIHFGMPTTKVTITVNPPGALMAEVLFSHRAGDPQFTHPTPTVWKLDAVLLPLQGIRILWCRASNRQEWLASMQDQGFKEGLE
jgi:hypothetical protein